LDKTPQFAVQKARAIDNLLVEALQQKAIADAPQPTKEEAQAFVSAHPDIFQERKILAVDQIRMPRPSDPGLLKSLQPLKTLEDIEGVLKSHNVPFQRGEGTLDAIGTDPHIMEAILKLPPQEIFVLPNGQGLVVDQIKDTKIQPFIGPDAVEYAQKLLQKERIQGLLSKSFGEMMSKAAPTVQFGKDYAAAQMTADVPAARSDAKKP
jgi:EpsD family peptidyl-prolyl cis-trans isomerase